MAGAAQDAGGGCSTYPGVTLTNVDAGSLNATWSCIASKCNALAACFTMVGCCRLVGLNPVEYLADVLPRLSRRVRVRTPPDLLPDEVMGLLLIARAQCPRALGSTLYVLGPFGREEQLMADSGDRAPSRTPQMVVGRTHILGGPALWAALLFVELRVINRRARRFGPS
jgi:hypothetical protein